tara:strand:- start:185 stop:454 length:270 start_codon:yes stop_codon:yes gene_type:complete
MKDRVQVVLQRVSDGEQRTVVDEDSEYADGAEFWWTEGNGGCDCNRGLYFERAAGRDPDNRMPCGDVAYRLVSLKIGSQEYVNEKGETP